MSAEALLVLYGGGVLCVPSYEEAVRQAAACLTIAAPGAALAVVQHGRRSDNTDHEDGWLVCHLGTWNATPATVAGRTWPGFVAARLHEDGRAVYTEQWAEVVLVLLAPGAGDARRHAFVLGARYPLHGGPPCNGGAQ